MRDNTVIANEIIRARSMYDYPGVFRNSFYGVGLVGLGWVAVKLGRLIERAQENVTLVIFPDVYET